jgi:CSLREA domain-containing protein
VVNVVGDAPDANTADGLCETATVGQCSLRAAIQQANASIGANTIQFSIPGVGPHTIAPTSALPTITDPVTVDGWSEPDYAGTPIIELNGTSAGPGANGLTITAGSSTVRGLVINRFNGSGIQLETNGNNTIQGNYIGTDLVGSADRGNASYGIHVFGVSNNTIGGTTAATRNVISGNDSDGICLESGASGNTIQGNYVGVNAAGTGALGNVNGISLNWTGTSNNLIGGTAAGAGNLISGNADHGVDIAFDVSNTTVQGNLIGTDVTGNANLGNGGQGVLINFNSTGNVIGGTTAAARNVISGNNANGVEITGGSTLNVVQGNYIGVNIAGAGSLGNTNAGISVQGTVSNTLGGSVGGAGNVIANNASGVVLSGNGATENAILGNSIYANSALGIDLNNNGVTANDGAKTGSQPNLLMDYPMFTTATLDGTTLTVAGYVGSAPSQSAFAGARVELFRSDNDASGYGEGQTYLGAFTADSSGNFSAALTVSGLSIGDRLTATATDGNGNTSEFGPNIIVTAATFVVNSTADAGDANTADGVCQTATPGQCTLRAAIQQANASTGTNPIQFNIPGGGPYTIQPASALPNITGAAIIDGWTQPGWTSAPIIEVNGALAGFTSGLRLVTGSNGSTLRGLVINSFQQSGVEIYSNANTLVGNYIGTDASGNLGAGNAWLGVDVAGDTNVIGGLTATERNVISANSLSGIWLDGNNNTVIGNYLGVNAAGSADLGNLECGVAVGVPGTGNLIGGTASGSRNVISGNDLPGVWLYGSSNTVEGNYVGTTAAGTAAVGNTYAGITISGGANNLIGGTAAGARNLISGNASDGIDLQDGAFNNTVQGNYIGTDVTGLAALGNTARGIEIAGSSNNLVGGTTAAAHNVISGNGGDGVLIRGDASNNTLQGNDVGLAADGTTALGNVDDGFDIKGTGNTIGGTAAGAGNRVAYNGDLGVLIDTSGANNAVLANSIYGNGDIGIDLDNDGASGTNDGVTANDGGDGDTGPNNLQNYPVLTSAVTSGSTLTITGSFNSSPNTTYRVEFFASSAADPTGYGEGQTYLGFANVTTDGAGDATLNSILSVAVGANQRITATATDPQNNTSEFSLNVVANTSGNLALNKPITTSSVEPGTTLTGAKTVDGNLATRWGSVEGIDPQWIYVDLLASYTINRVRLFWEDAYAQSYEIQVSNDASNWTTIYSTATGDGGVDDLIVSGTGRYVRMYGTQRGTAFGYSLWEFEVYGDGGPAAPPTTATMCTGASSTASSARLYDSGGPSSDYNDFETCTLLISPSAPHKTVTLAFESFSVEAGWDWLTIYDGTDASGALIGTYTGTDNPGIVTGISGSLYLEWQSDWSVTAPGWRATWSISNDPSVYPMCSATTASTLAAGTLYDSGGPSTDYENNESCGFRISPAGGASTITLSFSSFSTLAGDTVTVYDGVDTSGTVLGVYSGDSTMLGDVTATSGNMYIVFSSDATGVQPGFIATWTSTP